MRLPHRDVWCIRIQDKNESYPLILSFRCGHYIGGKLAMCSLYLLSQNTLLTSNIPIAGLRQTAQIQNQEYVLQAFLLPTHGNQYPQQKSFLHRRKVYELT